MIGNRQIDFCFEEVALAADLRRRSCQDEDSTDEVVDDEDGAAAAPLAEFAVPAAAALASATWEEGHQ